MANELIAGAAAEGNGALIGWEGQGTLTRGEMIEALAEAGLPEDWAPKAKTPVAYAGRAIQALNSRGFVSRRSKTPKKTKEGRAFRARWIVFSARSDDAEVGEAAGAVVLTAELEDDSDALRCKGDARLAEDIKQAYEEARDGEIFSAGDVTSWVRAVLYQRCGATRFGVGYYVPIGGRAVAQKLASAVSTRWGAGWICPLLPVATTDELKAGIGRGLLDDAKALRRSLVSARAAAAKEGKGEVSPAVAARMLVEVGKLDDKVRSYRPLCGDEFLRGAIEELSVLRDALAPIADDASQRFALIADEIAGEELPAKSEEAPQQLTLAERAADAALEKRRQGQGEDGSSEAPIAASGAVSEPARTKKPEPKTEELEPSDADERFSLLELD